MSSPKKTSDTTPFLVAVCLIFGGSIAKDCGLMHTGGTAVFAGVVILILWLLD